MSLLTAERARELLDYDPETGAFIWKVRRGKAAACTRAKVTTNGYLRIGIDGERHYAHRLAWLLMAGQWPTHEIDHKDRDRLNNRWANLRGATKMQNAGNRGINSNNTSGRKGVVWNKRSQKWRAQIKQNDRVVHLGGFNRIDDAARAYEIAAREYFAEFARTA